MCDVEDICTDLRRRRGGELGAGEGQGAAPTAALTDLCFLGRWEERAEVIAGSEYMFSGCRSVSVGSQQSSIETGLGTWTELEDDVCHCLFWS